MIGPKELDRFWPLIQAGTLDYEDAADLFLASMVGAATGVGRAELLARLRARFPDKAALNAFWQDKLALVEGMCITPQPNSDHRH